ncbi:MAG: exodeoxyribonuclease VII large subunit [Bacilli bacterium]|nr:exodeoxyribonuclease VII large subunit [Bacilli bacterium]
MENSKYLTITALTKYLKYKFDSDSNLKQVFLKGEISNLKFHTTGHLYFSLKDETSKINAIMFNTNTKRLIFKPTDGMNVLVTGRISVYEATGNYQIYVDDMLEDGVGNLYVAFEQLKEKLAKEGLFDERFKKKIPRIPAKIGIITASTGAAIRDILSTIKRRFPLCETYLYPALVQGRDAAPDIVKKLKQADQDGHDLIIVGRGGGSIEDLWAFNEEIVARAIFEAKTPIISAVGHEVDFTIADFVADLRAPTPTGAAEMAVPNLADVKVELNHLNIRCNEALYGKINILKMTLANIKANYILNNPAIMYENKKQLIDNTLEKIKTLVFFKVSNYNLKLDQIKKNYILMHPEELYSKKKFKLEKVITKLELLNPLTILKRGYNLTYKNEQIIKTIKDVKVDDNLKIKLFNGNIKVKVIEIEESR